jgi:hypothetical protein
METSNMQALDLEQWLTEQASVTNQCLDLEDQLFSRTSSHAEMETSTMQALDLEQWLTRTSTMLHLREMTSSPTEPAAEQHNLYCYTDCLYTHSCGQVSAQSDWI